MEESAARRVGADAGKAKGSPERSGGEPLARIQDTEVRDRAARRSFSAAYKLEILKRADACRKPGELGELLRSEGLYSSHLTAWRKQRDRGAIGALARRRGRKPEKNPLVAELERAKRENLRLTKELWKAHRIIECQKKVAEILEIPLTAPPELENENES